MCQKVLCSVRFGDNWQKNIQNLFFFFTCGFSIFVQVPPGLPGPPDPGLQVSQTPVVSPDGSHGFKLSFAS